MNNIYLSPSTNRYIPLSVVAVGEKEDEESVSREKEYLGYHLMCSKKGNGRLLVQGNEYELGEGTVFLLENDKAHKYYAVSKTWHTTWIIFKDENNIIKQMLKPPYIYSLHGDLFLNYHKQIFAEAKNSTINTAVKVSALLYRLVCEMCQEVKGKDDIHVKVLEYIHDNYSKSIGLEEIAEYTQYTKQHICRVFKEHFNLSPCEYITVYRINRAKQFLHNTSLSIAEIAKAVGFSDSSYFGYVFKKYEGTSPAKFRDLL